MSNPVSKEQVFERFARAHSALELAQIARQRAEIEVERCKREFREAKGQLVTFLSEEQIGKEEVGELRPVDGNGVPLIERPE